MRFVVFPRPRLSLSSREFVVHLHAHYLCGLLLPLGLHRTYRPRSHSTLRRMTSGCVVRNPHWAQVASLVCVLVRHVDLSSPMGPFFVARASIWGRAHEHKKQHKKRTIGCGCQKPSRSLSAPLVTSSRASELDSRSDLPGRRRGTLTSS